MQTDGSAATTWRWSWLLWIVAVAATVASSWVSILIVAFADGRTCDGVATSTNRDDGLFGVLVALAVVSFPWVAVLVSVRGHRMRLVVMSGQVVEPADGRAADG